MHGIGITRAQFLRYTLTPELRPRIAELFTRGFAHIPYLIALLYSAVGLLPAGHPYLQAENMGRFGVRHVVAEAANRLTLSWRNADQIAMFFVILAGVALIAAQIVMLPMAFMLSFTPAGAQSAFEMVTTPNPDQDVAFMLLDLIFGVEGIFGSCVSTGSGCTDVHGQTVLAGLGNYPQPIHHALHYLLGVYSAGIVIVAVFVTSYFVAAVVVETAQTGTPMGKRFTQAWVVPRLLLAIGLLIPMSSGLNSGQYIVLYAAKYGSGLATNGWVQFLETLEDESQGQNMDLIARPNIPEVGTVLQFYHVAATCKEAYEAADESLDIKPYLVRGVSHNVPYMEVAGTGYDEMVKFADGARRVFIRFGEADKDENPMEKGHVKPLCGELVFELTDPRPSDEASAGALIMQAGYWAMLQDLWADQFVAPNYPKETTKAEMPSLADDSIPQTLTEDRKRELVAKYQARARRALAAAISAELSANDSTISQAFKDKGWGFAGVLYNYVAEKGGRIATAVYAMFAPSHYPELMERVCEKRRAADQSVGFGIACFNPVLANGKMVELTPTETEMIAPMYAAAYDWSRGDTTAMAQRNPSSNGIIEFIHMIFGTEGLFNMRENANAHPLAQLTMIGRSLVESAVRNIGYGVGMGGGVAGLLKMVGFDGGGAMLGAVGGFMVTIATVAMSIGFLLFYIVPFLPFMYFFFGLGGWVKGIFEAMVGVPLWALAHIRIDGEGLSGKAAKDGYFLILEIFLRPILLIVGFLAGITIFSAMVLTLNETFDLVVVNLTGFSERESLDDPSFTDIEFYRSYIDVFFFTVVYAVTVYMMAMASFKLIDLIPNNILRWMGVSVKTFNDEQESPAEKMMQSASVGSQQAFSSVGKGLGGVVSAMSQKSGP